MNTNPDTPKTAITLEMIRQQKAEKLAEIQASKKKIARHVQELFHPSANTDNSNALMSNFSSGIAIFNGVMTGFKIIKRIRNLFRSR